MGHQLPELRCYQQTLQKYQFSLGFLHPEQVRLRTQQLRLVDQHIDHILDGHRYHTSLHKIIITFIRVQGDDSANSNILLQSGDNDFILFMKSLD